MDVYRLPVSSKNPSSRFQTVLDGVTYTLAFCWNERVGAWYMDVADAAGEPLVSGVRVVVGFPLANRPTLSGMFPGMLYAEDTSGRDLDPGLSDLGARVQLLYFAVTA